uniref:Uncharacterized protein n=1 Tax=Arundo donax TaxID=35708 RepID=A0A0A8Y9G9_ARUDO
MVLAVFTAVEVEPCGKAMKGVKHKSVCYSLGNNILHKWVL